MSAEKYKATKPSTAAVPSQRLPAPSLFVGPPSRNASNHSLSRSAQIATTREGVPATRAPSSPTSSTSPGTSAPISPAHPHRSRAQTASSTSTNANVNITHAVHGNRGPPPTNTTIRISDTFRSAASLRARPSKASVDAQWADLQRTLADIESSAAGAGNAHVFGAAHGRALEELRNAQIELAKAWGPGPGIGGELGAAAAAEREGKQQGGDSGVHGGRNTDAKGADGDGHGNGHRDKNGPIEGGKKARDKDRASERPAGKGGVAAEMDADAEQRRGEADLSAAAARRKANEEYFAQVKRGVQDVVAKLDAVSGAMKKVELESRDIWRDGESLASVDTRQTGPS